MPQNTSFIVRFFFVSFCCLLLGPASLVAQRNPVVLSAKVDSTRLLVGSPLNLDLTITAPTGAVTEELILGNLPKAKGLEVVEVMPRLTVRDKPDLLATQRIRLFTTTDTGLVTIPVIGLPYELDGQRDTAYSYPINLNVSLLPVAVDDELLANRPIIEEPLDWTDLWPFYLVFFALAVAFTGWMLYRYRAERRLPVVQDVSPAHELARRRLTELDGKQLWQAGRLQEFQTELSLILRRYLQDRYAVDAPEMVTAEIEAELARRGQVTGDQRSELGQLLRLADLVKFANATPDPGIHQRGLERVSAFVDATRMTEEEVAEVKRAAEAAELERKRAELEARKAARREQGARMANPLSGRPAPIPRRILATLLDLLGLVLLLYLLDLGYTAVGNYFFGTNSQPGWWAVPAAALFFVILLAVPPLLEVFFGGGLGKQLLGLRVYQSGGSDITFQQAFTRRFLRWQSLPVLLFGNRRAVIRRQVALPHDRITETSVYYK
ncbi:MAG: RDD family protein [Saprospiraceae bacterium]